MGCKGVESASCATAVTADKAIIKYVFMVWSAVDDFTQFIRAVVVCVF